MFTGNRLMLGPPFLEYILAQLFWIPWSALLHWR
jgi:hypothetical protein